MSTDMSKYQLKVRQVTNWQLTYTASGSQQESGTYTIQLILDAGAAEEILAVNEDDADNLFDFLSESKQVFYDMERRVLMFGTRKTGE